jgi:ABC-2 type transport system ATP-binding protein
MSLISLRDLAVDYGAFRALEADGVRLPAGAIGLLGPNGAGKSTLVKTLLGLLRPSRGGGEVLGLDIRSASAAIRRRIGYMSEHDSFVPGLNAVEFVSLAGELAGMPRRDSMRRAHEVLNYLGIEETRYRKIQEYSAGIRQRIKLAQALVHDPELLILDEPTNGLDPGGRRAMLELVTSLRRDFGKSIVLATHLLDDVERVCEHVLVLARGRVLTHGRVEDLRLAWKRRYRLEIEGDAGAFAAALAEAGAAPIESAARRVDGGARGPLPQAEIVIELPEDWPARRIFEVLASLKEAPLLRGLKPERESLEQLFERIVRSNGGERAT